MKTEEFTRKDGIKGQKYKLEAGDKVVSRFDKPRVNSFGQYENYSLGVTDEKLGEIYVVLTKGQYSKLKDVPSLEGKTIEAYEYENEYGKQVGVKAV